MRWQHRQRDGEYRSFPGDYRCRPFVEIALQMENTVRSQVTTGEGPVEDVRSQVTTGEGPVEDVRSQVTTGE